MTAPEDTEGWLLRRYDSPAEIAVKAEKSLKFSPGEVSQTKVPHGKPDFYEDHLARMARQGWFGTDTFDEAIKLAAEGWSAERPKVDAILEPIREKLAEKLDYTFARGHDMVGCEPDIDRFLAGELECMWDDVPTEAPTKGRVFTLVINGTVNYTIKRETILARGAAIAALVEAFQMLNYDLSIYVENSVSAGYGRSKGAGGKYNKHTILVQVHRAGDPLDINKVMFPIGNPAWLRRICFALQEQEPQFIRDRFGFHQGGGYGMPVGPLCDEMLDASFVMSMNAHPSDQDITDPVGWVLEQLELQGVYTPRD